MQKMPHVVAVMTAFPHSIDRADSVARARAMMDEHAIRHLPVTDGGGLFGIVSSVDLDTATALGLEAADTLDVGRVCQQRPLVVSTDAPLDEVVSAMASRQVDSAIVRKGDKLAGILTTTDVCRLLAKVLGEHYATPNGGGGGDEAA